MRCVVIDFESYFDSKTYTLRKQSTEHYVRDSRFQAHGAAIKWSPNHNAKWYDRDELPSVFAQEDWSDVFCISHHANFDHLILSHHYDVRPRVSGCTLSMARLMLGNHISVSLDSVRAQYGLPPKNTPYHLFDGKHWDEIPKEHQKLIGDGACDEVESIWILFQILMKDFPKSQLATVDILTRMFSQPMLRADVDLLARLWESESVKKGNLISELGITESDLQSADKFAELLRQEGVEPETKPGKRGSIYAFAKSDPFMEELREDDNERVRMLAEARLALKSTLLQTRAETLGYMAGRGPLCVYMRPFGAKTTRPSGGDKSNFLNLKKNDPDFPRDKGGINLRESIVAPEGYLFGIIDSSQIECRTLNEVAGQEDVVERFRNGEDPYIKVASQFYGFEVNKKDHPAERNVGKVIELQAGYQSGGEKIRATLRTKAGILITPAEGVKARDAYRNTHPFVNNLWSEAGRMIVRLAGGPPLEWGPVMLRDKRMILPNGAPIIYDTLEFHRPEPDEPHVKNFERDGYWRVKTRKGWEKLYGGKLVENLIQGLACVIVSDVMQRVDRMGYRVLNWPYDELLILIPRDGHEDQHLQRCMAEFRRPVEWLPQLPLDCEGSLSERYEK